VIAPDPGASRALAQPGQRRWRTFDGGYRQPGGAAQSPGNRLSSPDIRQSLTEPDAYTATTSKGPDAGSQLTDKQVNDLIAYLQTLK
jgi:hypothetical protein